MNISTATVISKSGKVTYGQLRDTIRRAYKAGAADDTRSKTNASFSKGAVFNIFCDMLQGNDEHPDDELIRGYRYRIPYHILREFGDYWEGWIPPATVLIPLLRHSAAIILAATTSLVV